MSSATNDCNAPRREREREREFPMFGGRKRKKIEGNQKEIQAFISSKGKGKKKFCPIKERKHQLLLSLLTVPLFYKSL